MSSSDEITAPHGKLRPASFVRVVFEGDPVSTRVEAVAADGHGGEVVVDLPVDHVALNVTSEGSRLVLSLGACVFELRAGVPVEHSELARGLDQLLEAQRNLEHKPR